MGDKMHTHEWEYPDCPECDTNVFVGGNNGRDSDVAGIDYRCEWCDTTFTP